MIFMPAVCAHSIWASASRQVRRPSLASIVRHESGTDTMLNDGNSCRATFTAGI